MNKILLPKNNFVTISLVGVVAIMMFLASLAFCGVFFLVQQTKQWQENLQQQITVQIAYSENLESESKQAVEILNTINGIENIKTLSKAENAELLKTWLGDEFNIESLPLPRLIVLQIDESFNLQQLQKTIKEKLPNASIDSQLEWQKQISNSRQAIVAFGIFIFAVAMLANVLAIIFATKGAMASNESVIEVLHFIGASNVYIARQFQFHFFKIGLLAVAIGGLACLIFLFIVWQFFTILVSPLNFYGGIIFIAILFALLTSFVARLVVLGTIK